MNQPDIAIIDQSTADGVLAAWAIRQRWPQVTVVNAPYEWDAEDLPGALFIVTGEPTEHAEKGLRDLAGACRWLFVAANDGEPMLRALREEGLLQYCHNIERSMAVLAWGYAMGEGRTVPRLLSAVQDFALDEFRLDGTANLIAAINSYDWDGDTITDLVRRCEDPAKRPTLEAEGAAILRYLQKVESAEKAE